MFNEETTRPNKPGWMTEAALSDIEDTLQAFEDFCTSVTRAPIKIRVYGVAMHDAKYDGVAALRDAGERHKRMLDTKELSSLEWAWKQMVMEARKPRT